MDETKTTREKSKDKDYKKRRVEEIGSTLAQIKARVKANRSCARKDDDSKASSREVLSEKSEKYIQVLELDKAKAQKLERERPKIKEAIENLMIDRENQKLVEKQIEETRAKQSAPLPEIPVEVQKRISDLEITVHNLRETLSEKERILESKTESWRLLSDQLEQRNIEVVERYEVMAKEIDEVKKSYGEQEVFLRTELDKCKARLHNSDSLLISQENLRKSSEEVKAELEKLKSTHSECEAQLEESKKAFESEHRLCLKLQAKIKTYRNQVNSKKDESSEVERLKNEIATLEDEKESASRNVMRVQELEEALKTTRADLSEVRQQLDLVNNEYSDLCSKLEMKEEHICSLKLSLEKMEQSKISSEFKAAELEEKMEAENREDRAQNDKMCKEIDNLKQHVKQQEETVEMLRNAIILKEDEIKMLKESGSADYSFSYDTHDLKELLEEWKHKYTRIEETVHSVEEEKENLRHQIQSLQAELDSVSSKSLDIASELSKKEAIIQDYITMNEQLTRSLAENSGKISELEIKLNSNSKTDDQTSKLKKLAANLKIKVKLCKELEDKVTDLSEKLSRHENIITTLTDEKLELENMLSEYKIKLENVSLDSDVVEQLKNLLSEKEGTIQRLIEQQNRRLLAAETAALNRARTESQCEIVERDSTIKHLKEENLLLESKLNENLIEVHCVGECDTKIVTNESVTSSGELNLNKSLQDRVDALTQVVENSNYELENKIKIIEELGLTINDLTSQLRNKEKSESEPVLGDQTELIKDLRAELDSFKTCQESVNSDITERNYLLEQIKMLQVELESCRDIIAKKEDIITHFEREISLLKSEVNLNESQMNKIQALYVQEYNKKDGLLTNIETELNLSKNEILILSDQLSEVTKNYDQCFDKLKEKDECIDKLQKDLDSMKTRVENLQSSIAERQKSMEMTAEQLGQKLNEASCVSINFEKYRLDMEQKLVKFTENEKQFNSKINELLQDIDVLKASNEEFMKINETLASDKKTQEIKVNELESELNDIKCAYNTTLDQIELLNEELKQVMSQIEYRNQELVRIGEERNSLIGRMSELEDTCSQLKSQLQQHEQQSESLKTELDYKLKELDVATAEITNLQNQLGTNQLADGVELNKELDVLKKEYEERLRELQLEKEDLMKLIKGTVASEVDSVMKAAEDQIENKNEIKLFSWEGHTESNLDIDSGPIDELQDDGWGWNFSDAKLEEEYQNSEANKVRQMSDEILQLKSVNSTLEDEVKMLKIKCSKLVTKVKELKAASEKDKSKTGFEDLNFAMQEEMRSQVDEMDKKNKELSTDIGAMKIEKERLLKRIETLTSANNQLIEMKERQDIEVQVWQRNCADLKSQLQSFDWNESEIKPQAQPAPKELTKNTDSELEDKLSFLETENEELLQIICSLKDEKQANSNLIVELSSLKEENILLKESALNRNQNDEVNDLKQLLDSERLELQNKISFIDQLSQEKDNIEVELNQMKQEFVQTKEKYDSLSDQMNSFSVNNEQITTDYESLKSDLSLKNSDIVNLTGEVNSLQETITSLNLANKQLKLACSAKDGEISELKERLSQLDSAILQIQEMQNEQMQLSSEIERLQAVIQTLSEDNSKLASSYESKVLEMNLLKADTKMLEACKDSAMNELQSLREELINIKSHRDNRKMEESKLYEPPSACTVFKDVSETTPPIFQMSVPETVVDSVFSSSIKTVSAPVDISSDKYAPNQSNIPESPPVFRGFFSNQNDTFSSSIQQQFDVTTESNVIQSSSQDDLEMAFKCNTPSGFEPVDTDQVENLKSTVMKLEEENFSLIKQLKTMTENKDLDRDVSSKLAEKDSEINVLRDQITQLNQQIRSFSVNFESEKSELFITNQELLKKISEYETSLKSQREEIQRLKSELDELRRFHSNETEKLMNEEARRRRESETEQSRQNEMRALQESLEEQMRQSEKNLQNLLLSKDEENAHLTCEVSAKEAVCNKLTLQLEELNKQMRGLENEMKASKDQNESVESQLNYFKRDVERLNMENSELRKVKENENQLYVAQVDYLQQSLQEKDASLESLSATCNQLQHQLSTLHQQYEAATERSSYLENCYSSLNATHGQLTADYSAVEDRLRSADSEITRLNTSLSSLTKDLDEHRSRLEQERVSNESLKGEESQRLGLLTDQIEILQSSVTEKDLEIERLSKLLTGLQEKLIKVEESKITDDVVRLRRKLDDSLYTLHLRDVRCDELTVEIMQLLEERDSLQLRLSEAIRECESLRASSTAPPDRVPPTETSTSLPHSKSSQQLHNKIGELHTGYMKDPTVQMERENRYSQQMQLFTSPDCESGSEQVKTEETLQSDYGLLNWFFSSRTWPQPSQESGS